MNHHDTLLNIFVPTFIILLFVCAVARGLHNLWLGYREEQREKRKREEGNERKQQ